MGLLFKINCVEERILEEKAISSFFNTCIQNNKPVLIKNIFSLFPSLSKFDFLYLKKILANKRVKLDKGFVHFDNYYEELMHPSIGNDLYLWQQSLEQIHPELKQHFDVSSLIPNSETVQSNLWVGPKNTKSELHFDLLNNFYFQLFGSKSFYIISPNNLFNVYAKSPISDSPNISKLDLLNVNDKKFPKISNANIYRVDLGPGSCLFLPSCWWHQVISNEASISINVWTKRSLFEPILEKYQMIPFGCKSLLKSLLANLSIKN